MSHDKDSIALLSMVINLLPEEDMTTLVLSFVRLPGAGRLLIWRARGSSLWLLEVDPSSSLTNNALQVSSDSCSPCA
jgi:hypothetical protein